MFINSWLTWVGTKYYPTFKSFAQEAVEVGISRRVPNIGIAASLMRPSTVVFLVHDDGRRLPCPDCSVPYRCPICDGEGQVAAFDGSIEPCEECSQTGRVMFGTGGSAVVDGQTIDYRRYWGMAKHPQTYQLGGNSCKFYSCGRCGGLGRVPDSYIRGFFVPQWIEYILRPGLDVRLDIMRRYGATIKTVAEALAESSRVPGYRSPGGVYVMTNPLDTVDIGPIIDEVVRLGMATRKSIADHGAFAMFNNPISILGRHFLGIKRWSFDNGLHVKDS